VSPIRFLGRDRIIEKGPILLQHHGNPLQFRNIFIKPLTK
jgi:hypothetical protein